MKRNGAVFWLVPTLVLLWAPLAASQPLHQQLEAGAQSAWGKGVSPERQAAAAALFQQGNEFYEKAVFSKAAELYRQALGQWDHPAIRYNLALALMDTGLKLELREHLEAAMRYGEAPLDQKLLEHARNLRTFIEKQLVQVDVSCELPGTTVTMDGRLLFTAPGRYEGWVLPGSHVFVATREGSPPNERIRTPGEGQKITLNLSELYGDQELTRYRRLWSAWKPWVVVGAGAALAAGGGWFHLQARDDLRGFDARATKCGLEGCAPSREFDELRDRGGRFQKVAVGTYAAGGALFVTGAVLAYINRAEPYRLTPDEYERETRVAVQLGGGRRELLLTFRF